MLFFGAGASKDAGVSTVVELVSDFKKILQAQNDTLPLACIEEILSIIKTWKQNRNDDSDIDIEELLDAIEKIEDRDDNLLAQFFVNNNLKLTRYLELEAKYAPRKKFLSDILKFSIAISTGRKKIDIRYLQPLSEFVSLYKPVNIFSTNYDVCVERFCVINSKKYFDGFDQEWTGSFSNRSDKDILLYKLHGSITWFKSERGKYTRNEIMVKDSIDPQTNIVTGDIEVPLILYPGRKLEYSEPAFDTLRELKRYLETDEALYSFTVGYSFRDDHIKKLFHHAAERNPNFILILISPSAYDVYRSQLEYYKETEFHHKTATPSKLKQRTICLPYEFKKIFPYLKDKYLQNISHGLYSENNHDWITCLQHYSECEYWIGAEKIIERIDITKADARSWTVVFESTFQALLNLLYANDDEMLHKWREIFRTICDRVSIDNYSFIPQLHDRIELRNFGDLNISSLSNSIGNVISESNTKLQIMSDKKANAVKEALNKAKLWKDYLDQWADIMRYEQYCNLRRDDYHEQIEHLTPFLDFNVRTRHYEETGEDAFIEMGEHIRQIEITELRRIYQNLLV